MRVCVCVRVCQLPILFQSKNAQWKSWNKFIKVPIYSKQYVTETIFPDTEDVIYLFIQFPK